MAAEICGRPIQILAKKEAGRLGQTGSVSMTFTGLPPVIHHLGPRLQMFQNLHQTVPLPGCLIFKLVNLREMVLVQIMTFDPGAVGMENTFGQTDFHILLLLFCSELSARVCLKSITNSRAAVRVLCCPEISSANQVNPIRLNFIRSVRT